MLKSIENDTLLLILAPLAMLGSGMGCDRAVPGCARLCLAMLPTFSKRVTDIDFSFSGHAGADAGHLGGILEAYLRKRRPKARIQDGAPVGQHGAQPFCPILLGSIWLYRAKMGQDTKNRQNPLGNTITRRHGI